MLRINAHAVFGVFFPSYFMRARSLFCFGSLVDFDRLFDPFCRQSLALCPILWQLKHRFSFICLFLSSMVILLMSIAFGSLVNLGVVDEIVLTVASFYCSKS